jgi:hypothetical protein
VRTFALVLDVERWHELVAVSLAETLGDALQRAECPSNVERIVVDNARANPTAGDVQQLVRLVGQAEVRLIDRLAGMLAEPDIS